MTIGSAITFRGTVEYMRLWSAVVGLSLACMKIVSKQRSCIYMGQECEDYKSALITH